MKDRSFPPVVQWDPQPHPPGYIEPGEWFSYQYPIVKAYFQKLLGGWHLGDFLAGLGCKTVVLYAITDFAEFAARDLTQFTPEIQLKYFACNDAGRHPEGYLGKAVYGVERLAEDYRSRGIDKIVICNIFHANEIFDSLLAAGIRLEDLISICAAIYQS